jgi:hypothetical protein
MKLDNFGKSGPYSILEDVYWQGISGVADILSAVQQVFAERISSEDVSKLLIMHKENKHPAEIRHPSF